MEKLENSRVKYEAPSSTVGGGGGQVECAYTYVPKSRSEWMRILSTSSMALGSLGGSHRATWEKREGFQWRNRVKPQAQPQDAWVLRDVVYNPGHLGSAEAGRWDQTELGAQTLELFLNSGMEMGGWKD